jgi:hypothetical protein
MRGDLDLINRVAGTESQSSTILVYGFDPAASPASLLRIMIW